MATRAQIAKPSPAPIPTRPSATSSPARVTPILGGNMVPPGMRLRRTAELPSDLTEEEAAKLEAEGRAAQKKLGLGPLPQPVPDVKKLIKKEEKKEKLKPEAKGKKGERGKGKAAPKSGGAVAAPRIAVGPSKVAQYLATKGAPVLLKGFGMLRKLKQNEQTHDDAAEKLQQSEKAVVIPPSEGQSKSNTGQVTAVSARPVPTVDENKGKQKLQETLAENVPQTIEDVDNFKRDQKAQHMGADVLKVVQGDKNAVVSTFDTMEHTPLPTPSEHTPEALPPEEVAPPTADMNLGQGAVAPLQKEHTDVSNYTKEADSKLKEEGITQEQLDMVDSGDLAEANKEKKGMEKTAKTEPLAVQTFAQQETAKVDRDLKQEEKKERDRLKAKRKAGLGATAQKQKGTKSALEKKREEVAGKINGIFKAAQDKVKKKLADLETQSMKRFDDGNAKATRQFEDNVNRELNAFKADRYSGWFGWARKAKDWLLGMDDLPEVQAIFDRNRATFVNTINKLVDDITADNKRVIQECKDELANAKKEIKEYVDKLEPNLTDIGKKAQEEMNGKLDELDQFVAKKEQELQNNLKDKQQAAIKAIDEKIEKMKEAMAGALAKLGKLLLWAAKKFFTWALEKFGFSLEEIEGIINKGVAVLKAIFTQPIQFVKNLVKAAVTGFDNFRKNFLKHLKDAVFEWLTGSLEGIQLPSSWDLKGIVSVALQMLGLTWSNIRGKLVKLVGEPVVKGLENTFTLVKTLVTEGPMAAWEQLKEMAGEMQTAFIDAVKEWIRNSIIYKAVETILSMFIPGAGIIRAIIGIYDTIVFFIQKAKDIIQMVGNFLGSIAEIAAGNIGAAAGALENGLARALKLVIDFLARFLRLSGITKKIQEAIQKIRGKVDAVLDKVVDWIVAQARRVGRAVVGTAARAVEGITEWWTERMPFRARNGEEHTIFFEGRDANARLMIATSPIDYVAFVNRLNAPTPQAAAAKANALAAATQINTVRAHPTMPANAKTVAIRNAVRRVVRETGEVLLLAGPGTNAYPGSGIDPASRTNIQLWQDLLPVPLPGSAETGTQIVERRMMARGLLFQRYAGASRDIATQVHRHNLGRDMRPFSAQRNESEHTPDAHVIRRHVLNGRGEIKNIRDVALRALLNTPPTTAFTASAFASVNDADTAIQTAITGHIAALGGWPAFREHLISTTPGANATPARMAAGGPRVEIWKNRRNSVVPEADLPAYLRGYTFAGTTISAAPTGTRPLYTGDPTPGLSGQPLAIRAPFSGTIELILHPHRSAIGGYWVRTAYPVV